MELEHNHVVPVVVGLAAGAVEQLTWPILHVVLPVLSDKWKRGRGYQSWGPKTGWIFFARVGLKLRHIIIRS